MHIKRLEAKNFRNYEDLSIDFDERVNLVTGKNAQGKTNLVEALYLSSIGRSFRTNRDAEMIRFGEDNAYIKVSAEKELITTNVEIVINKESKKAIKKDGTTLKSASKLLNNIIIVVFSPDDLKIVKEEPEKRRRFIDRELSQIKPAYYEALMKYKKALAERNKYLKSGKIEESMISLWDDVLIKYGASIMMMRKEFIDKLTGISSGIHNGITNEKEELLIKYEPNIGFFPDRKELEENIERELIAGRDKDLRTMSTGRGPHKDDMSFYIGDVNVRNYGSQGQQRTAALSLKLAELELIREETGERAVLLLDDVMSELDEERREYLIRALSGNQLFITTTDIDDSLTKAYPDAKIIQVKSGKIV